MGTFVGRSLPRFEDRRFLTRLRRYVANLDLPGQAQAVAVPPPAEHAQLAGIDAAAGG